MAVRTKRFVKRLRQVSLKIGHDDLLLFLAYRDRAWEMFWENCQLHGGYTFDAQIFGFAITGLGDKLSNSLYRLGGLMAEW